MSKKLDDDQKKKYTSLNLPVTMVEDLKNYRLACSACEGRNVTFEEMMTEMMREYYRIRRNRRGDNFVFVFNEIKEKRQSL